MKAEIIFILTVGILITIFLWPGFELKHKWAPILIGIFWPFWVIYFVYKIFTTD